MDRTRDEKKRAVPEELNCKVGNETHTSTVSIPGGMIN
jgi:hypothetical protein